MLTRFKETTFMRKHFSSHSLHFIACCLLMFTAILCVGITTYATNDDPGAGRLSGSDIPAAFYESSPISNDTTEEGIRRFGDASTKSPYTKKTYTHRSDLVDRPITHGIDVSQYQKNIDWQKVKADGIKYAIIRVGYRGSTQGTLNEDPYFRQNIQGALAAGIEVGVYIFSQATTKKEAVEEANYLLERIKDYNITFPVVLDYEFTSGSGRLEEAKLSKEKATNVCLAFCETVQAAGYTPMVYANPDMLNNHLNPENISDKYLIWLANYTTATSYTGKYDYWQYSSDGTVDGIEGRVDMNFFYGTDIANATVAAIPDQMYTGKKVKPAPVITYKDRILTADIDYTVDYTDNKKIGTATMTITGKNTFFGTQTLQFKIMPKQMSAVKSKKKSTDYINLSWKKDSSVSGYQIYRASAIDGKYKKLTTITKKSATTYKNTKLTNGQCYYYKIRSYKTVNGKKWYGAFSEVKAIYTKTGYTRTAVAKDYAAIYATAAVSEIPLVTPLKNETMSITYATKDRDGNTWYYVTYEKDGLTYNGFIESSQVKITLKGKVTTKDVNVRKKASTSSKVLTTLNKNKKVTILKTKKKKGMTWYQIEFKKKGTTYKGWISADFVKLV